MTQEERRDEIIKNANEAVWRIHVNSEKYQVRPKNFVRSRPAHDDKGVGDYPTSIEMKK